MKKRFTFFILSLVLLFGIFLSLNFSSNIKSVELSSDMVGGVIEKLTVLSCGTLSIAGETYTLTGDVNSTTTCFTISAPNIVLDCQDNKIIYSTGGSSGYGIISNQFNTTIKNCNIIDGNRASSSTSRYGIYWSNADNGTIQNTIVNASNSAAIRVYSGSDNNLFYRTTFISSSQEGMRFYSSKNNIILNSTIVSNSNHGVYMFDASTGNVIDNTYIKSISNIALNIKSPSDKISISNSNIVSDTFIAMNIESNNNTIYNSNGIVTLADSAGDRGISILGNGNKIINSVGNATSDGRGIVLLGSDYSEIINSKGFSVNGYGIYIDSSTYNYVSNSTFYSNGNIVSYLTAISTNNVFEGNRFVSLDGNGTLISISSGSRGNLFYYNNFTQTTGQYIDNFDSTNQFNTIINGISQGNIYFNIASLNIIDSNSDGFGDSGINYPLSSSTWPNKWNGYGADYGPYLNSVEGNTTIISGEDLIAPTYTNVSVSNTFAGQIADFMIKINDEGGLQSSGQYIFSINNGDFWVNDSAVNFTSTPSWINVTKVLNSNVGSLVSYIWYFTDNSGNVNNSGERSFIIEEYISCSDTCLSLGYTCGIQNICGENVVCGSCSNGYTCQTGGSCVLNVPSCISHSYSGCYDGDIYWYNSCNEVEEKINDCNSSQTCTSGVCVNTQLTGAIIIDHTTTDISKIPDYWLEEAKELTIQYAHRSDGGNIIEGLYSLYQKNSTLRVNRLVNSLPSQTNPPGIRMMDGNPPLNSYSFPELFWSTEEGRNATLNNWKTGNFNASMWSWCNELDVATAPLAQVQSYLDTMNSMEESKTGNYSNLDFIYMTGYTDNTNPSNVVNNQLIRDYAIANGKILYDFEDIGKYDPDGVYYPNADRECTWCASWCENNPEECVNLPTCSHVSAEDGGLVCIQRANAFWWMMARLAGWDGVTENSTNNTTPFDIVPPNIIINSPLSQSYDLGFVTLNITAVDSSEVDSCLYSLNSEENISMENNLENYFSLPINLSLPGNYEIAFYCNDSLGNENFVSENFTINKKSPQVSLTYKVIPNCDIIEGEGIPVLFVNGEAVELGAEYDLSEGNYTFNCSLYETDNYNYIEVISKMILINI